MKRKVPYWFSRLEEEVLRSLDSRKLKKEYMLEGKNHIASLPQLEKLQDDKRFKDWVIIKKKNLNQILLGRVDKKLKCKTVVDHWLEVYEEKGSVRIERCRGCHLNSKGKENDCQIVVNQSEHIKSISGVFRKENC